MSPELKAHDLGLLRLGKGIVKFDRFDKDGLPTGLRDVGNVPSMTLTPTEEVIEHYTAREAIKNLDAIIPLSRKIIAKFTLEEFDRENLRLALFGETGSYAIRGLTAGTIEGLLDFMATNAQGPKFHLQMWRARLKPTGDIGMIDDTALGKMEFEFTALNDVTNHPLSPYFDLTLLGES
jgi:hypothetical protein